jgi:ABC transport system ATP-binding/permease protein
MTCPICGASLPTNLQNCPQCGTLQVISSTIRPVSIGLAIDGPGGRQEYSDLAGTIVIGRTADNTIALPNDQVSRRHAQIEIRLAGWTVMDLGSTNGTLLNGTHLIQHQAAVLASGDVLQIGSYTIHIRSAGSPPSGTTPAPEHTHDVSRPTTLRLGRAPDNDVVLDHPQVSRYHAIVEMARETVSIRDLGSTNGTFVNGQLLDATRALHEGDTVQIGMFRLVLHAGQLEQFNDQGNIGVDAYHLIKTVGKGMRVIDDVSISIRPREFVAIVGGSGAGKSTLLDALNGFRPATEGAVLYNGMDLYQNYDVFRNAIGYVPQDDIIHLELTVYGALNYVAQLRLSRDTTDQERRERIEQVLKDLGLEQRRDTPIHRLSGGQRKRVSIGVELLSQPSLLFLDEPTSGLDPSTETKMMRLMRELANQGRTVILVTHVTGNVGLCDKAIVMGRGGRLAYYGPPKEALPFFEVNDFVEIYDQLDTANPQDLKKKYEQSPQFRQFIAQPLQAQYEHAAKAQRAERARPGFKRISAWRQFLVLSRRNLEILTRDRASLALMLLLAPIIGSTDFVSWNRNLFDSTVGSATQSITMLYLLAINCILVGSIASMREIVKESEIYRRERMVGLGILPYVLSKVWLGAVLALYQGLIFLVLKVVAFPGLPHDPLTLMLLYLTLVLTILLGMLMGLFVSAIAPNQNVAPLLVILLLVPQFLFSGGLLPIKTLPAGTFTSATTGARWAFEA